MHTVTNNHLAHLCPTPPDWHLDWTAVLAAFPILTTLESVPQEPAHHAEGNVLIHTRTVAHAMTALPAWRALPTTDRTALFIAALLHDIAKGRCTVVDDEGHISAPGHARAGAYDARLLLWQEMDVPFWDRERIVRLVRHHGLPLWFWDRDINRTLIATSQTTRLDHVALLAEADVRGRICADQNELLDRVSLFREAGAELGCLDHPYGFADDHSRVCYFEGAATPYAAYDDTVCDVTLMSGMPGAGKDTWIAANHPGVPVISLDRLREELHVSPTESQSVVVAAAKEQARIYLRAHQSFVWNATNISHTMRAQLIGLFRRYRARVTIVYVDAPWLEIVRRNRERERGVPLAALQSLARKLDVPDCTEAHEVVYITPSHNDQG